MAKNEEIESGGKERGSHEDTGDITEKPSTFHGRKLARPHTLQTLDYVYSSQLHGICEVLRTILSITHMHTNTQIYTYNE